MRGDRSDPVLFDRSDPFVQQHMKVLCDAGSPIYSLAVKLGSKIQCHGITGPISCWEIQ